MSTGRDAELSGAKPSPLPRSWLIFGTRPLCLLVSHRMTLEISPLYRH